MKKSVLSGLAFALFAALGFGQAMPDTVHFLEQGILEFPGLEYVYHARVAPNDPRYVYAACADWGMRVMDIGQPNNPQLIGTFPPSFFGGQKIGNLKAVGNLLYVGVGALQGPADSSGIAIMDISNPAQPTLISQWDSTAFLDGIAVVEVDGPHVYLGGMADGLHILDAGNPGNVQFRSTIVPDTNWNPLPNLDPNGRGMAVRNDTVFLAYDSGGLRLIDVSDKSQPVEVYKYWSVDLTSQAAPAYNNVILHGTKAFISVDYCGLEVVDFGTPDTIVPVAWFNPYGCFLANWPNVHGHTNEMAWLDPGRILLASAGSTDLVAIDVSDLANIRVAGTYGSTQDSAASWGLALSGTTAILSFLDNSGIPPWIPQPYYSDRGGIAVVDVQQLSTQLEDPFIEKPPVVFPQPASDFFRIRWEQSAPQQISITDLTGKAVYRQTGPLGGGEVKIPTEGWPPGIYLLELHHSRGIFRKKISIQ